MLTFIRKYYGKATLLSSFSTILLLLAASASKIPDTTLEKISWGWLLSSIEFLVQWNFLVVVLAIVGLVTSHIIKSFGSPKYWKTVEELLEQLRKHAINEKYIDVDRVHHHRVTLFKHKKFCWRAIFSKHIFKFASGWLIPIARSGHTTLHTRSIFRAPKNKPDDVEGVAGQCWAIGGVIPIYNLKLPILNDDESIVSYVENTWWNREGVIKEINNGSSLPRSFYAFPVFKEARRDGIWGVVVIDSRQPDGIKSNEHLVLPTEIAQNLLKHLV